MYLKWTDNENIMHQKQVENEPHHVTIDRQIKHKRTKKGSTNIPKRGKNKLTKTS